MFHGTHPVTIKLKCLYPTWISILNLQLDTQLWFIRANIGNIPLNKMFVLTRAYIFYRIPTTWSCKSLIVLYVTKVACFSHSFCFYCTTEIFFFWIDFGFWIDFDTNMYFNFCNKILTFPGVLLEAQQIIFYKKSV